MKPVLDINCDLGEGIGNDAVLMPLIHSCNIACGGHYGDAATISDTIKLAVKHNINIGAHPSYPDRKNFGRKPLNLSKSELKATLVKQLSLFLAISESETVKPTHIKLHGALYNQSAADKNIAITVLESFIDLKTSLKLFAPPHSYLADLGRDHFEIVHEAFIDRTYQNNGSLTARKEPNALIIDPKLAWLQLNDLYHNEKVKTIEGNSILMKAQTFCIHGDSPSALKTLEYIKKMLRNE